MLSPACMDVQASMSAGPCDDYLLAPTASLQSSIAASSLAASSLNSAGWGSSLESFGAGPSPQLPQQPPAPAPLASVHDSAATVQSVDLSKALQQAQAQAQVHGMGSQVSGIAASHTRPQTQALGCSDTWQDARRLQPYNEAGSA